MPDPRFFKRAGPFTLDALCLLSGATLLDREQGGRRYCDVAPLETAGPEDVSFLENRRYVEAFVHSRAGAAFVDESLVERAPPEMALLVSREPYKAYALAAQAFYPGTGAIARKAPSAIIDPRPRYPMIAKSVPML